MKISKETTWDDISKPKFSFLKNQINADVAVVGGGMAGVLIAYELAKAGKKVALLEAKEIGSGVTSYTTAFLTNVVDTDLSDLVKMYGLRGAKTVWESHYQAIDYLEQVAADEGIECEFVRCSNYAFVYEPDEFESLEADHKAAQKIGFDTVLAGPEQLEFKNGGSWVIRRQGKFHATKFLYGVAKALKNLGVEVYEHTEVTKIDRRGIVSVHTKGGGQVIADDVVIATYKPFNNPKEVLFKKGMYKSYVFEVEIPKGAFIEGIYEDNNNPYNYFRVDAGKKHDRMIIGGQDHRTEIKIDAKRNFKALEGVLKHVMDGHKYRITRKWSSAVLEPADGLALIGQTNAHEYVATAFSGNGMTYSAISALLIKDLILGNKNSWKKIYDPTRIPSLYQLGRKARDYTGELVGGALNNLRQPKKPVKSVGRK